MGNFVPTPLHLAGSGKDIGGFRVHSHKQFFHLYADLLPKYREYVTVAHLDNTGDLFVRCFGRDFEAPREGNALINIKVAY